MAKFLFFFVCSSFLFNFSLALALNLFSLISLSSECFARYFEHIMGDAAVAINSIARNVTLGISFREHYEHIKG